MFGRKRIQELENQRDTLEIEKQQLEQKLKALTSDFESYKEANQTIKNAQVIDQRFLTPQQEIQQKSFTLISQISELLFEPMSTSEGNNEDIERNQH
ncbi:hypothetical protein OAH87_02415, partial [Marinomonas sp.]